MNQGGYLLLSMIGFFLTGAGLYAIDSKITVGFRRFLHGWTSPKSEPFPPSKAKGLVYRQGARQRFVVAGTISAVQTILSVYRLEFNPLLELSTLLIESPIMVLGTYFGDRMIRVFDRAQPVFDAIDRIESGESTAGGETRELFESISDKVRGGEAKDATQAGDRDKAQSSADSAAEGALPPDAVEAAASESPPPKTPEDDPRALMRKYTGE